MSSMQAPARPGAVSRALARDRLGVPAVLFFVLAGVAPLTVAAGVIPTAYATTGLTGIPAAFIVIAVILAVFATGRWLGRFQAFDLALDRHHPADLPHHHHLAILAVRPDSQGQGTGTALLNAHHAALDRDGMPAYLEASRQDTRRIYLRHGYILRPDAPIRLPDGGPEMWPMWREPQV
jgi:GNAT superfamily N-acetyltransferase